MPAGHLMISRRRRCSLTAGSRGCWSLYQLTFGTSVQPAYPASFGDVGTGVPKKTHTSPVTTCKLHADVPGPQSTCPCLCSGLAQLRRSERASEEKPSGGRMEDGWSPKEKRACGTAAWSFHPGKEKKITETSARIIRND
ncbi:uncharacterized protein LOC144079427 isoform X2 [Stigmatopora argus]